MAHPGSVPAVKTDDAWSALGEVNQWIRFADAKASVLLAVGGVVGGIVLSRPAPGAADVVTSRGIAWTVAMIAVALSSLFSLLALLPQLRVRRQEPTSLLYFRHIAAQFAGKQREYEARFAQIADSPEAMRDEVAAQIWANSLVARRKFREVAFATWLIGVGLVGCAVTVYLDRV
jgi:hypothetical protein